MNRYVEFVMSSNVTVALYCAYGYRRPSHKKIYQEQVCGMVGEWHHLISEVKGTSQERAILTVVWGQCIFSSTC